ncbi:phospholipase D-like domain-containing protein [Vibrio gallaecicus]|uniref:Phospholipase D-like domain-containing protein n=1 Tax=Vibrio gallaecicus TaxID=552386 RepID=A0ABV4NHG6_9VIBR
MSTLEVQQESFTKHYHDQLLPPIFIDQGCSAEDNLSLPEFMEVVEQQTIVSIIDNTRLTLLLAADRLTNADIIKALQNSADKGVRIYLYLGNKHKNKEAISALSSRCLIRTGEPQQGALLISDHATFSPVGHILNSSTVFTNSEDDDNFLIILTAEQIQDTYRSFCHLFWDKSEKQVIKQGEKLENAVANPAGTIVVNHQYQLPEQLAGNFTQASDIKFSQLNHHDLDAVIVSKLSQATNNILDLNKAELAESLVNNNKNVALTDFNIPNIVATNSGCWFIPNGATNQQANWSLKLNHQQSTELTNSLNQAFEAAQWQLDQSRLVESLDSPFRFVDEANNVYQCEQSLERELDPVCTDNMNSFLYDNIEVLTSSDTELTREYLAKSIHYNVQRHPPYCPQAASKAQLYSKWDGANQNWLTELADLEFKLDRLDKKRTSVSQSILSFFNSFSLGQQHKHKKLKKSIFELRQLDMITATPAERAEQQSNYLSCFKQLSHDDDATDQAIDKAKLEKQWHDKKEQLTKSLQHKEGIYSQEKRNVNTLKAGEEDKYTLAYDEFVASRDKAAVTLTQQLDQDNEKLASMPLQQAIQWINKNSKSNPKLAELLTLHSMRVKEIKNSHSSKETSKEAKESENEQRQRQILANENLFMVDWKKQCEQTLNKQKEEISKIYSMEPTALSEWLTKNTNKSLKKMLETHTQLRKKVIRDLDSAQKKLDNALNDQKIAQDALDKHGSAFSYRKTNESDELSKQLGNKKSKSHAKHINWPNEALPICQELELFEANNQRYLTFSSLDLFELAQQEAQRLNAELCAPQQAREDI